LVVLAASTGAGIATGAMSDGGNSKPEVAGNTSKSLDQVYSEQLAARQRVYQTDGAIAGWADRDSLHERPNIAGDEETSEANFETWLSKLAPVTATQDPTSKLVGYWARNYGFVDLATANDPSFDLKALQAAAQARNDEVSRQIESNPK
ncbi:MAG TPA: hypothetical protein VGA62_10210, partial [Acidimicrobiia bacterium]